MNLIPWRYIDRWECLRCGKCCRELDVPVTLDEEKRLRKFGDVFSKKKIGVYLKKVGGCCIFLEGNRCRIYDLRPEACRRYPFYFRSKGCSDAKIVVGERVIFVYIDPACPGLGSGRKVVDTIFELLSEKLIVV